MIALSIVCGLFVGLINAALDYLIFYRDVRGTFLEMLLTDPPAHEIYIRLLILLTFAGFGVVVSWVMSRQRRAVDALRESEERFRLLFERSPIGYQSLDADGRFLEVNPVWLDALGYDRPEVVGQWFGDFLAPEYQDLFRERFPRFKEAGEVHGVQFEMVRKDGDRLIVEFDGRVGHDEQGNFKQMHCVLRDVTKQKQAQEALWESQRFLQTVVDAVPEMMLVIDRDYRVVLANRTAKTFCGSEDPVAAGMKCHQVTRRCDDPCAAPADPCPLEQVVATGEPVSVVHVYRDARGDETFMEINAAPIFDGRGEVVQMIESCRDVTERMRSDEALRAAHDELEQKVQQRTAELETSNRQLTQEIAERKEAEEQLALFKRFVEVSGEGMGWAGLRGNVRYINSALCRIFGEDRPEDAYGKPVLRYYSEETQRRLQEEIFPAVLREGAWSGDLVIQSRTGKRIPTTNSLVVLRDSKGSPLGFANVATDLTERKRIEDELRKHRGHLEELVAERTTELEKANAELKREIGERKRTEKQLRLLSSAVQQSTEGMAVVGLDGCLQFCNQAFAEVHGYTPEELTGKDLSVFHTPQQIPSVEAADRQVKETGQFVGEIWHLRRDGSVFPARMHNTLLRDDSGAPIGIVGTLRDVTELKRTEEALRESEARFRELFDNMSSGVAVCEAVDGGGDFVLRDFNKAGERIEGIAKDEVIGGRLTETFPGVRKFGLLEVFRRVWRTGTPEYHPVTLYQDERIAGWRENYVYKLPSGEVVAIYDDVTERKQAEREREELIEQLENQNAELERFTYTVSHDLKNPLITIKGYLGLLEEDMAGGKDEAVEDDMERMSRAADRMVELLDELLELSRIGRMANPSEHVPLAEVAREAVELVAGRIAERGVVVEISPELPVVFGDRSRLREVLQNLVENAVKYMGDQPRPRIEIGARLGRGEPICYVRDNGLGIEPRYQEKIFGLFDQLDGRAEGTGIGLALVKRIVEVHGGRVWVESEGLERGATFCFCTAPEDKTENPVENEL